MVGQFLAFIACATWCQGWKTTSDLFPFVLEEEEQSETDIVASFCAFGLREEHVICLRRREVVKMSMYIPIGVCYCLAPVGTHISSDSCAVIADVSFESILDILLSLRAFGIHFSMYCLIFEACKWSEDIHIDELFLSVDTRHLTGATNISIFVQRFRTGTKEHQKSLDFFWWNSDSSYGVGEDAGVQNTKVGFICTCRRS
jgi:hypothetical protein